MYEQFAGGPTGDSFTRLKKVTGHQSVVTEELLCF